MFVVAFIMLHL